MEAGDGRAVRQPGSGVSELLPTDPRQIGDYRLLGVLGAGGMGRVYLGIKATRASASAAAPQLAAVKRVHPQFAADARFRQYFGHELDNLGRLPAGLSARLLDFDRDGAEPWFATEYVPGVTLDQALDVVDVLPEACLWRLLLEAAQALAAVHALGIIHRDLKPSNIILTIDGIKLIDFGVARAMDQSRATVTGMAVGTPSFMAPEQATGSKDLTGKVDVFALGSVLAFAAQGEPPFGLGSAPDQLYRVVHVDPDLANLTARLPQLTGLIADCLVKSATARPSAADLVARATALCPTWLHSAGVAAGSPWPPKVADLIRKRAAFAAERSAEPTRVAPPPPLPPPTRMFSPPPKPGQASRAGYVAAAVIAVIALAGGVVWGVQASSKGETPPAYTSPPYTSSPYSDPLPTTDFPFPTDTTPSPTDPSTSPATDPAAVVEAYYQAINNQDYATAWALGGDNLGQSYTAFVEGFSSTLSDSVTVEDASATTAAIQLTATQSDGTQKQYSGTYTVANGVITSARVTPIG